MAAIRDDRAAARYALAAALLWSTVASAFKLTLRHLDVVQLLFYANAVAVLTVFLIIAAKGRVPRIFSLTRKEWSHAALLGLLNPLAYYLILFGAYDRLPAQVAQALNYTWAIMLMLLSVPLLHHRVTHRDATGAAFCYGGAVVVCLAGRVTPFGELSLPGIALALGSTVIWALYWILKTRDPQDPLVGLFISFLFALPFTAAVCAAWSTLLPPDLAGLAGAAYVGVFEMGVTFALWLAALQAATAAAKVSLFIFLSPFLSLVFIYFVVGEPLYPTTLLGLSLIVAGLWVQRRSTNPQGSVAQTCFRKRAPGAKRSHKSFR